MNICSQVENCKRNAKKPNRTSDRHDVGPKVTTKLDFFEDATDALLMEISKISSNTLNGIPATGQTHMFDMSSPGIRGSTATHDNMETEILNELCEEEADQFRADDILCIGGNRMNERNGDASPLYKRFDDDALRRATINGDVPSEIADTEASVTCVQQGSEKMQVSECEKYGWTGPPFFHPKDSQIRFSKWRLVT